MPYKGIILCPWADIFANVAKGGERTLTQVAKTFAGARLRRLREDRGLTQVALARALGLSTSYVNQLENDQRPITVSVLLTLAERFDLPTQYFAPDSDARLVADLREVLAEGPATAAQIEELVAGPNMSNGKFERPGPSRSGTA